ncbi:hypothetical protein HHA03_23360 [Halolactibacillus halophilus]|uniref:Collagen adhesin n=1 Tax=Halolactibacillus halophilus TaxID=306540 RepID=A0ABQ0VNU5_9BACI|nr:hypothetical protein HHA03_23360 [Halolactibacillus halophilus]
MQEPLNDVTDAVLNDNFQLDVATDAKSFNLDMGEIDSAYRIEYRTEVNDRVGEEYKNGAILTGADDLNLTTDATVAVTRGNPLAKTSSNYDDVAQTIDWEVKYNYDEKTIPQGRATLIDEFGNVNQTLDVDSFEIYQVSINPDTGEETGETLYENYTLTENENGYTVQFNESIDGAFKLKYRTNTIDRVENDAEVTNTISDDFENTAGGNQGIGQGILIKNNTGANYQDKTTDWSITINRDEELMQETIFKDTLPVGFTFQPDTLSVEGYDGDYDVTYDTNDTNNQYITIHFNGDITERVTLSYRTDIDYNAVERDAEGLVKASYLNDASVDWIPENQETSVKKKATAAFNPDDFTRNNGFKYGSYNVASKEMTWTIGVNYNEEDLQGVKVTDSLIGDQNFTKEDVKVYQMNLTPGANEFELGTEVTSEFTISDLTEPGFEVDFGDITTGYVIIFTTDFKDQQVAETYENTATVSSTNREPATLEASVSPRFGGEYTTKEGQQNTDNGRIVNWTVNINRSQSLLNDLVIKDTPSINQSLVQDSFVIYETTATADNIVKNEGATLEEGTDYDLEFSAAENGQESFTITFKGDKQEIEEAYVLTYDTYILYKGDGNIGNDLSISGDQVVENTGGSSVNRAISFNSISGSITGEVGSLVIKKVDAEDITLLEGAEFQLYDESGEVLLRTGTTDSAGNLTFVNLLYGNYQLKEVTPPDGYVIDRTVGDTRVVTVDSNAGTVDNPDVTVENYKIKRDVRLTKVDGTTNDKLAGVEFELFQADDTQVTSFTETDLTTNASGEIYLEDLAPGDYYFKEKTPIANYQANTNEYSFTIKEDHIILDIDADALTVENELIPGRGEMRKIDADKLDTANNGLAGARFRIESTDDGISFGRTVTSGENGLIETGDLRPGNYTIEETSAPNGFTLSERDPIAFTIPLNTVSADTVTISSDPFENNVKTTAIEVTKQDSINGQLLPGAEFELTYSNGDYDLDSSPRTGVTDESGKVTFDDLKPGTYQLKETKTPDGYISSSTPIEITVTLGDVHNARVIRETVENAPYANVTLKKVDAETSTALAGAIFDVEDTSGGKITGYENITTDENGNISITGLPAGTYQLRETQAPDGYTIQTGGYLSDPFTVDAGVTETEGISLGNVGNDIIKGSVKLVKVDGDTTDNLENVEFQLEAISLVNGGTYETTTHSTDANGEIIIDDLRPGTYRFVETGPLSGYQPYWGTSSFTLNFPHDEDQVEVEVRNYQRISIDVEKVWNDQSNVDNRPESVTIELLRNGAATGETKQLTSDNDWKATFESLDVVDAEEASYTYTLREVAPGTGYQQESTTGNQVDGFTITNVETRSVEVEKVWLDDENRLGFRPTEIDVQLMRGETPIGTPVTLTGSADWTYQFENLLRYAPDGTEYQYTVEEVEVPTNYEFVEVNGNQADGYQLVNRLVDTVGIPVSKVWNDTTMTAKRPDTITVEVYQKVYDAVEYPDSSFAEIEIGSGNTGEFTDLPKYDDQGREFVYQVVEVPVSGYSTDVIESDGNVVITNTRSEETTVSGEKIWRDDDVDDRPESITINLVQTLDGNEIVYDTVEVTEEMGWVYTFDALPAFNDVGAAFSYQVTEQDVPGYAVETDGFDIINTRSEQRNIEVTKGWLDDNNPGRPDEVSVTLFKNDEAFQTAKLLSSKDWTYVFEGLASYDENGQAIAYRIEEEPVDGYESMIDGFNITNVRTGTTDVTVNKIWQDDSDATGNRPDTITLNVFRSDNETDAYRTATIGQEDNWSHTFSNLPTYDAQGKVLSYTVEEVSVEGYSTSIEEIDSETYEITNTITEEIAIDVTKTWLDDQDTSARPDSITVDLYRNDNLKEPLRTATLEENFNTWTHAFTGLERFDQEGVEYEYTIEEREVPEGYVLKEITGDASSGFVITNLRDDKTSVSGTKTWQDDNEDNRPETITVNLLQTVDGNTVVYDTVDVTEESDWAYVFESLPVFNEVGKAYQYSVTEQDVPGYASDVSGFNITNTRTALRDIEITKGWLDDENLNRPAEISVTLYANDEPVKIVTMKAEENWTYLVRDLAAYDENGQAIAYRIEEEPVDGYESIIDGFNITNVRQELGDITVTKAWLDDDASASRPNEISIDLYRNDNPEEPHQTITLNEEGDWTHTFNSLEKFDSEGVAYQYTVEESNVPEGYRVHSITGKAETGFTITNVRVGIVTLEGRKMWESDQSSDRPETITVEVYQNDKLYQTLIVDASNNWSYQINDVPQFDEAGIPYVYTIDEQPVEGYTTKIDGFNIINRKNESLSQGDTLPDTATQTFNLVLIGLVLIGMSAMIWIGLRFKKNKQ